MGVTFGAPVYSGLTNNVTTASLSLSGVTSGQPIIIVLFALNATSESPSFSDSFSSHYTYTKITGAGASYQGSYVLTETWIGTGGSGTSGTISVSNLGGNYNGGYAVSCVGASTASGLSAIDTYGFNSSSTTSTQMITPSLSPTAGGGAIYAVGNNGYPISSSPGSPWVVTNLPSPSTLCGAATYSNVPSGALQTSWYQSTAYGSWCTVAVVVKAATFTVTFNANGGTGTMANETNSSATALTTNAFTYAAHTFLHWNTAADGSGTSYADEASYPFTANVTLYAQWKTNNLGNFFAFM
jgi:hypothetical protein